MCGIAAYFGPGVVDGDRILASLGHRGPDARGRWGCTLPFGTQIEFLHTRLKILDLSEAGAQPMALRDGLSERPGEGGTPDAVLVYNGEIYNFREIRARLESAGERVRSSGDTEVLLRALIRWGPEILRDLDGIFSLVLFLARERRLIVARDHAGIKPLYYARARDGGLVFASEVRAVVNSGVWEGELDRESVADYLRFGSFQEPRTLYAGIRCFPPGHWAEVRLDEGSPVALSVRPYWLPERISVVGGGKLSEWEEEHDRRLRRTVEEQLAADVPVGVFLSGGVDSNVILELAAPLGGERLTAFTLAGTATAHNEASVAMESCRRWGIRHRVVTLSEADLGQWAIDGLAAMDQPSNDGLNTYLVSRASRTADIVVALGGTGADELHGAYGYAGELARLARNARRLGVFGPSLTKLAVGVHRWRRGEVAGDRAEQLLAEARSPWRMTFERRRFFTDRQISGLWPEGLEQMPRLTPPYADDIAFSRLGFEESVRITELRGYLLNTLLRDCDWATMANQQELRVPFLGRAYMEWVLQMPERITAADSTGAKPKLQRVLTPEGRRIAQLPKRGFVLNYVSLLSGPLRSHFQIAVQQLRERLGFRLDADAEIAALLADPSGKYSRRAWALFALGNYLALHGR